MLATLLGWPRRVSRYIVTYVDGVWQVIDRERIGSGQRRYEEWGGIGGGTLSGMIPKGASLPASRMHGVT